MRSIGLGWRAVPAIVALLASSLSSLPVSPPALAGDEIDEDAAGKTALVWLHHVLAGRTDEAIAITAIPFAVGKRVPDDPRVEGKVFETLETVRPLLASAKAPHKLELWNVVKSIAAVARDEAAKEATLAKVLPEGGWRVTIGDSTDKNPDTHEVYLTRAGKVVATVEVER